MLWVRLVSAFVPESIIPVKNPHEEGPLLEEGLIKSQLKGLPLKVMDCSFVMCMNGEALF